VGDTSSCQNGTHGILVTTSVDDQTSSRIVVKGNTCDDNTGSGIIVGEALRLVSHAAVGDNVATGNGALGVGDGISVNGSQIAVNCNVCCNNAGIDISFAGDTPSMTYVGNVRGTDSAPTVPGAGYDANGLAAPGTNVPCAAA